MGSNHSLGNLPWLGAWTIPAYVGAGILALWSGLAAKLVQSFMASTEGLLATLAAGSSALVHNFEVDAAVVGGLALIAGALLHIAGAFHPRFEHHGKRVMSRSAVSLVVIAAIIAGGVGLLMGGMGTVVANVQHNVPSDAGSVPSAFVGH